MTTTDLLTAWSAHEARRAEAEPGYQVRCKRINSVTYHVLMGGSEHMVRSDRFRPIYAAIVEYAVREAIDAEGWGIQMTIEYGETETTIGDFLGDPSALRSKVDPNPCNAPLTAYLRAVGALDEEVTT